MTYLTKSKFFSYYLPFILSAALLATAGFFWLTLNAPVAQASFSSDTFTESSNTALASHVPDVGASWTKVIGAGAVTVSGSSKVAYSTGANELTTWIIGAASATADYDVQADFAMANGLESSLFLMGRCSASSKIGYGVSYASSQWQLVYWNDGTSSIVAPTQLGTYVGDSPATATRTVKLQMRGSALTVFIGGVSRISATDSTITAAGRACIGNYYSSTINGAGTYIDNWSSTDAKTGNFAQVGGKFRQVGGKVIIK